MGLEFEGSSQNYASLLKRQNELISFMQEGVKGLLNKKKVTVIEGKGRVVGEGQVEVNGDTLAFKNLILTTGSTLVKPDFPVADLGGPITSDGAVTLGLETTKRKGYKFDFKKILQWLGIVGKGLVREYLQTQRILIVDREQIFFISTIFFLDTHRSFS